MKNKTKVVVGVSVLAFALALSLCRPIISTWQNRSNPPIFYTNSEDNLHCLHAATMMVMNSLGRKVHWNTVNAELQFERNKYTWTAASALYLARHLPGTRMYSTLDYVKFAEHGQSYLRTYYTPQDFRLQSQTSSADFVSEQRLAKKLVDEKLFELRIISKNELRTILRSNLVIAWVRPEILYGESRPGAHFIVLYDSDDEMIWFHDPGLPARPASMLAFSRVYASIGEVIVIPVNGIQFRGGGKKRV